MLEIKMISLIGIVVITSYIGFLKANTFVEREKEINLILISLNIMKNKIEYTNMYLRNIFLEISNEIYKGKDNLFKNTIESKLSLRNGFKESVKLNSKLNNSDKNILLDLSINLGAVDKNIQISDIKIAYGFLLDKLEEARIERSKNTKMYKTLGVVSGLTISIILI